MIEYQKDILKKKKVLVTGANGFTGKHVCLDLKKRGILFAVILRPGSNTQWMERNEIKVFFADLNNFEQLTLYIKGYDYLINPASLGFINVDLLIKAVIFRLKELYS